MCLILEPGEIEDSGDELIFLQGAQGKFETGVITCDVVTDKPGGNSWGHIAIANRGIARFGYDNQRLSITMPHTANFSNGGIDVSLG